MTYLLDINVLIALLDPAHVHHDPAHNWFAREGAKSWASCPLTENGALRIVGHARYPNSPGSPAAILALLEEFCAHPGHIFWPDDITLRDDAKIEAAHLLNSAMVTDTYLLALARTHQGRLATFDRRMVASTVRGGSSALHRIGID